jgi:hypothetical protein
MAQSPPANTTCDIYRPGFSPPAAPNVVGVKIFLTSDYQRREETGEGDASTLRYTHLALMPNGTDVRDLFGQFAGTGIGDACWVPDRNGTPFRVHKVDSVGIGTGNAYLRVYLDRGTPPWPTSNL